MDNPKRTAYLDRYTAASGVGGFAFGLADTGPLATIGMTAVVGAIQYLRDPEAAEPEALILDVVASGLGWVLGETIAARSRARR